MAGFSRASLVLVLLCLVSSSEGREILVGGKTDAWEIPNPSQSDSLNQWSENSRFRIGDTLGESGPFRALLLHQWGPGPLPKGPEADCGRPVFKPQQAFRYGSGAVSVEFDGPALAPTSGSAGFGGGLAVVFGVLAGWVLM
ncbi:hypothetical protein C3L33_08996, partial [Rhododendron williamsianum]